MAKPSRQWPGSVPRNKRLQWDTNHDLPLYHRRVERSVTGPFLVSLSRIWAASPTCRRPYPPQITPPLSLEPPSQDCLQQSALRRHVPSATCIAAMSTLDLKHSDCSMNPCMHLQTEQLGALRQ